MGEHILPVLVGCVKKIDKYKHTVVMTDQTIIPIEQISNIEGEMFEE